MESIVSSLIEKNLKRTAAIVLTQVYSYYFGSSRGSARKDETIAKMTT